jgi:hypothetical protein
VFEAGAIKYERSNWMLGLENDKLMDSALRHLQAYAGGEEVDAETGCHHLGHAVWNVKVLLEQVLASKVKEEEPKPDWLKNAVRGTISASDIDHNAVARWQMIRSPVMLFDDFTGRMDISKLPKITREELADMVNTEVSKWDDLEDGQMVIVEGKGRFIITPSPLNLKSEAVGGSMKSRKVIPRKELSQLLNKNISYVEKMKDGQVVVLDGTEFVVRGD